MPTTSVLTSIAQFSPVSDDCPVEVFRWGGKHHDQENTAHQHTFDEILLIRQGGGEHEIQGRVYPLHAGTVHFLPAGVPHQVRRLPPCDGGTIVFLQAHVVAEPYLPFKQLDFLQSAQPVLTPPVQDFADIWLLYEQLLYESKKQHQFYQKPLVLSWLNAILVKIAACYKAACTDAAGVHPIITAFQDLLQAHFRTERSVAFYAQQLHLSPQYLHEVCRRETGRGPQAIIAYRVAAEALALLSAGQWSVKEIAYELGFEDPAYFSRFLKKQTGKSPTEWQEN